MKYLVQRGMTDLNDLMDHILYQIFKIILGISSETETENPPVRIYKNKIESRITFKIKTAYYLELLTPETMKFLGSTENKISKDKNGENVPHSEISEAVLVHCNMVKNDYQHDSRVLDTFVPKKSIAQLLDTSQKNYIF